MFKGVGYVRPKLHRETVPEQLFRHGLELDKVREHYTLQVVQNVSRWFETQRMLGEMYNEVDCQIEAAVQCRLEGVVCDHLGAAVGLITDIYFGR